MAAVRGPETTSYTEYSVGGKDVKFRKLGLKTEEMSSSVIPQLATLLATTAHITWLVNICLHTNFLH